MPKKEFPWRDGKILDEHSKRKHKILAEYFQKYLSIRCQSPRQERFRLAIVDGFAGGGRYKGGEPGSPIIFIESLSRTVNAINLLRAQQGMRTIEVQCLLLLNDADEDVVHLLRGNCTPILLAAKEECQNLQIQVEYTSDFFETAYPRIKEKLKSGGYGNCLFNLDQCGDSHVKMSTLIDIMRLGKSVEIFYTFMISSLLAYLNKSNPDGLAKRLHKLDIEKTEMSKLAGGRNNDEWLGKAERLVFENFYRCAPYVSPFSINNPSGWRYWLIHFANSYRARQEYNITLHDNATLQAHFGRSGLNMLSYDPREDGAPYLFDVSGRASSKQQLLEDIPKLISEFGDTLVVHDFYENIYNLTPAHKEDIDAAAFEHPDLEVLTDAGNERRKATTIHSTDTIKLKRQGSFWGLFMQRPEKQND